MAGEEDCGKGKIGLLLNHEVSPLTAIDPKLLEDPLFQRVTADALAIQHRFAAEPVYAKTG
jgi:hypothetical protein